MVVNMSNPNTYIAHIRKSDNQIQTVSDHLRAVQSGCEIYGAKMNVSHLAGMAGWLHDLGKNTTGFKTYIVDAVTHPDTSPRRGSVDHSTAGGRFLYRRYHKKATTPMERLAVEWMANCIISHHQGLRDYLDTDLNSPFLERVAVKLQGLEEYEEAESEFWGEWTDVDVDTYFSKAVQEVTMALDSIRRCALPPISSALLVKFMFSCLIDADRTNTLQFEEGEGESWEGQHQDFFERGYAKLMAELRTYDENSTADHPINRLRRDMSQQCDEFAKRPHGIYTLSIPTGGGKTLASLRFALKHAQVHKKERIIYIVPYTTIIEQNADEIRSILQEESLILEHHSNVIEDVDDGKGDADLRKKRLNMARDNWDRPLIFTTMVQFLNTFYAKGTRNVRRLHRLANAVLIFDEVQAIPPKCVSLFNAALNFLSTFGQSTSVLCTATQPTLEFVKNKLHLPQQAEIIHDMEEVNKRFKRVDVQDLTASQFGVAELTTFIQEQMVDLNQVLVILNTKSAVRKLYIQLKGEPWVSENGVTVFHLSTNMCAAHRKVVLQQARVALDAKKPVICVSTQLIEAGVNISFDCVIRSIAGLDSIAQAAGRCNRHGRDRIRKVYVIQSSDEVLTHLPEIRIGAEATRRIFIDFQRDPEEFGNDLLSSQAMRTYFKYYFHYISGELDYPIPELDKNAFDLLDRNEELYEAYCHKHGSRPEVLSRPSFATAEKYFEVIRDAGTSVLVPYNDQARELLIRLNGELEPEELGELLHQSQQYVVNLYDHDARILDKNGDLYQLLHGHVLALRETAYSQQFGVESEGSGEWQPEFA
jgi:CRISPR-associated endonuclease/helicase Cas3